MGAVDKRGAVGLGDCWAGVCGSHPFPPPQRRRPVVGNPGGAKGWGTRIFLMGDGRKGKGKNRLGFVVPTLESKDDSRMGHPRWCWCGRKTGCFYPWPLTL